MWFNRESGNRTNLGAIVSTRGARFLRCDSTKAIDQLPGLIEPMDISLAGRQLRDHWPVLLAELRNKDSDERPARRHLFCGEMTRFNSVIVSGKCDSPTTPAVPSFSLPHWHNVHPKRELDILPKGQMADCHREWDSNSSHSLHCRAMIASSQIKCASIDRLGRHC